MRFVRDRLLEHGPDLKPAYTTTGGDVPDERPLALPGYPGGTNIVGNWVNQQFQLDGFGESLLLFAAAARHDHLDADGWRATEAAAATIEARWRGRAAGIWEIDPDEWTHSRLICAAGLRAISHHSPAMNRPLTGSLSQTRSSPTPPAHALHPSGRWQRSRNYERLDAALLLPAIRGAIPADDPRTLGRDPARLRGGAHRRRLRLPLPPRPTAARGRRGRLPSLRLWMALAWTQQGDALAATRWFERNRAACGPPGLLSEEFDVAQRQLRGNLPQAFVHALLLESAAALQRLEGT